MVWSVPVDLLRDTSPRLKEELEKLPDLPARKTLSSLADYINVREF